jgi:hypothetical protein
MSRLSNVIAITTLTINLATLNYAETHFESYQSTYDDPYKTYRLHFKLGTNINDTTNEQTLSTIANTNSSKESYELDNTIQVMMTGLLNTGYLDQTVYAGVSYEHYSTIAKADNLPVIDLKGKTLLILGAIYFDPLTEYIGPGFQIGVYGGLGQNMETDAVWTKINGSKENVNIGFEGYASRLGVSVNLWLDDVIVGAYGQWSHHSGIKQTDSEGHNLDLITDFFTVGIDLGVCL